jgi:hypothetical protein
MKRDGLLETSETWQNRTVSFPVTMDNAATNKIKVEGRFPNWQRPGDKLVSYISSETRELNSNAVLPL